MKVAIVNSFFPPWRGGAETYTQNLARQLVARGHEVTVICADDPLAAGEYNENGVLVKRLHLVTKLYGTPIIAKLNETLTNLDTDILHANFPSPYIAYIVSRTSTQKKVPAVLTWHNDLPPVTLGAMMLIGLHDHFVLPRYIRKYKRIISTSQTYANQSRILPKLRSLVTVIPNGVDCKRFHPGNEGTSIREEFNPQDEFALLFVGALTKWHRYKGLDVLLEGLHAAKSVTRDVRLIVVGGGDLEEHYRAITRSLHLEGNVIFAGNVPDEELPLYYAASDALVLPSKDMSEGFGLTLLEANASGKPVIASEIGGIPSVVRDGHNGLLVPPNKPADLAKAILLMKGNPAKAREMGENGRLWAEEHDWSVVASNTEMVYEDVVR